MVNIIIFGVKLIIILITEIAKGEIYEI